MLLLALRNLRARKLIPNIQTAIIPGAGHALNFDQPELVNARLLEFLKTPHENRPVVAGLTFRHPATPDA
jgi:hypothetical protein